MKLSSLQNKLNKLNVSFEIIDYTDYNKGLKFFINGKNIIASYNSDKLKIEDYSHSYAYDDSIQETCRRF